MIALYIICAIILLLLVLCAIPIKAKFRFSYNENDGEITIHYLFLKFFILPKKEKPQKEKTQKKEPKTTDKEPKPKKKKPIKKYIKILKESLPDIKKGLVSLLDYILKKTITVSELNLSIRFGLDDAMYTGMGSGAIYTAVYTVVDKLKKDHGLKKCNINIEPDFEESIISAGVYSVIQTNLFHILAILGIIIKLAIKLLINLWRFRNYE